MRTLVMALLLVSSSALAQTYVLPSRNAGSPYAPGTPRNPLTVYQGGRATQMLVAPRPGYPAGSTHNPYVVYPLQPMPLPMDDRRGP